MTMAETKITLFHLPREIRDVIYELALGFHQLRLRYGCNGFLISPPVPEIVWPSVEGLPLWLLTSRTIHDEGVNVLLRTRHISPNTPMHRHKRAPSRTRGCFPGSHLPKLTHRQRVSRRAEQQQQRSETTSQQATTHTTTPLKEATPASSPPTLSCSPVSQSLLLHPGSVRHMVLNFPSKLDFERAPHYFYDLTYRNDVRPWIELLDMVHPFVHPSNLRLTLTWDAKNPEYLEPYFDWPAEWFGQFAHVVVTLLATEAHSAELKQRIEEVVDRLLKRSENHMRPAIWAMGPVYEEPALPPCEMHGDACPHIGLQRRRRSETSRYSLQMTA